VGTTGCDLWCWSFSSVVPKKNCEARVVLNYDFNHDRTICTLGMKRNSSPPQQSIKKLWRFGARGFDRLTMYIQPQVEAADGRRAGNFKQNAHPFCHGQRTQWTNQAFKFLQSIYMYSYLHSEPQTASLSVVCVDQQLLLLEGVTIYSLNYRCVRSLL